MEQKQITNIINTIGKLKDLKRSGWTLRNVALPESDADHSYGVAFLAMMLTPENLNKQRCLELALIHDLAEVYAGDFTPYDNISKNDKDKLEREGALRLSKELEWPHLTDLVAEYNDKQTPEARFVNLLDKLETVMTASYYDSNNRAPQSLIDEFSSYAKKFAEQFEDCKIKDIINSF